MMKKFLVAAILLAGLSSAALANAVQQLNPIYTTPYTYPPQEFYGGQPLVSGSYMYAFRNGNFTVSNVSNPAAPTIVATLTNSGMSSDRIASFGRYLYLGGSFINVIDVIDPTVPVLVNQVYNNQIPRQLVISGNYLFAMSNHFGSEHLTVYDFSVATAPVLVATLVMTEAATDLAISGNYAFLTGMSGKLQVVDISNPTAPLLVTSLNLGTSAYGVAISGSYAYVTTHDTEVDGYEGYCGPVQGELNVVDISNPLCPRVVSSIWTIRAPEHLVISGRYAYINERYIVDGQPGDFSVVDIGNPTAPLLLAFGIKPSSGELAVSSSNVYVTGLYSGMFIFNAYGSTPPQACTP